MSLKRTSGFQHETADQGGDAGGGTAGKRTRTQGLAVQRKAAATPSAPAASPAPASWSDDPYGLHLPVQRHGESEADPSQVHAAAQAGVAGGGGSLPFMDAIQASFGSHDVRGVSAHVGGAATAACADMGATAYATGNDVAFAAAPDLHTAAHEAAHIVQQRGGVQLKGGVGEVNDPYERHADAVADLVVQGRSAQTALDDLTPTGGGSSGAVQRYVVLNPAALAQVAAQATVRYTGQETGADPAHPNSFMAPGGATNFVPLAATPPLKVSDDGNLAIEDADITARQAKCFFIDAGMIAGVNAALATAGSKYRIVAQGGTIQVPSGGGMRTLTRVEAQMAAAPGAAVTGPVRCNEMAEDVMGTKEPLMTPAMNLAGGDVELNTLDRGARGAAFVTGYAAEDAKNEGRWNVNPRKKRGDAQRRAAEAAGTEAASFTYENDAGSERIAPKVRVVVTDAAAFPPALERFGTAYMIASGRGTTTLEVICNTAPDRARLDNDVTLTALITDLTELEPLVIPIPPKGDPVKMVAKQNALGLAYGTLGAARLDTTAEKLGINEYAEPGIGEGFQILPTGVPDAHGNIHDHRRNADVAAGFPYHWGGVVATSGPDMITLENYARNDEDGPGAGPKAVEDRAFFNMYGSARSLSADTQSFHEVWSQFFANAITIPHKKA